MSEALCPTHKSSRDSSGWSPATTRRRSGSSPRITPWMNRSGRISAAVTWPDSSAARASPSSMAVTRQYWAMSSMPPM